MIIVGLTGPTGAGKGVLARVFEENGIPVLDCDAVSRLVCERGTPCLAELVREFGEGILARDGTLDRKRLAEEVFESEHHEEKLKKLNAITHKHILAYVDAWVDEKKAAGAAAAVVDAPQLFESGYDKKCDFIIGVTAERSTRIKRIEERDAIGEEAAEGRVNSQKSDEFFSKNCSVLLHNDKSAEELEKDAIFYIEKLRRGEIPC